MIETHLSLVVQKVDSAPGKGGGEGGGGAGCVLGLMFVEYVLLASQSPYPIIVYFLASYRPHLSPFLENVIFAIAT